MNDGILRGWGQRIRRGALGVGLVLGMNLLAPGCGEAPVANGGANTGSGTGSALSASGETPATPSNLGAKASEPAPATSEPKTVPTASNAKGIYAVSDVYTVLPDGTVSEITAGKFGALARQNHAFDGATNTIHLYGIQNQEVAVQIVIPWQGKKFRAQAGAIDQIPADRVSFSWIAYDAVVKTDKATQKPLPPLHLPDVIVPLDGSINGIKSFDVPQALKGLPKVDNQQGLMLMEVWIPKTTRPGMHPGTIRIFEDETVVADLNVQVHVQGAMLPDRPTFRMDYLTYSSPLGEFKLDSVLGDGAASDLKTSAEAIRVEQGIYAMMLDNRGFLNILPYASQRGNARYGYPYKGKGAEAKIASFEGFDARFGDLLSGKLGKYKIAPACFTMAFNLNYPHTSLSETRDHFDFRPFKKSIPDGPGKEPKLKVWEDTHRAIAQQMLTHFAEKGWKHTAFELYYNQKPADNNRSPWKLDEPVEADDYLGLRYLLNTGKWAFAGAAEKGVQVVTRIDIGHWECDRMHTLDGKITQCYKAKEFNTGNAQKVLGPVVDRWVAGYTHVMGSQWLVGEYNTDKVMFDTYTGSNIVYSHGGAFVATGWICHGTGIEGKVIYKTSLSSPEQLDGDSTLFSAAGLGVNTALVSRRIKLWRNGVNDYDLLALAKKRNPAATKALLDQVLMVGPAANDRYRDDSKTIETYFTNNVEDIVIAQRIAAAIAAGVKPDAALKLEGFSKAFTGCGAADTIVGYD